MKNISSSIFTLGLLNCFNLTAQEPDSNKVIQFQEVIIKENQSINGKEYMPILKENVIYAGKKTEVILMDKINADLTSNNSRQVFAKVPGISIWENDGSGIQTGIAARGLSPNRSWEFNVRQNGYDISSEVFGYPETYYTPPLEALSKIEVTRGAASLQFGPQFGGLINYQFKKGDSKKPFTFESQQTFGTYGLFNRYNAIGGTLKKFSYFGFLHSRNANGWRENSTYNTHTGYISANYQISSKINISGEYTKMDYKSQQSGGLTDKQFQENHRQSFRERNWFSAPFNVASLTLKYDINEKLNLQIKSFYTYAERNSVGYTKSIITKDSINATTLDFNTRQVDRDNYNNYGAEIRTSYKYNLIGKESILAGGIRAYKGNTKRKQLGIGTTGHEYDLTLTKPEYGRLLEFETINYALFAENIFQIGSKLKIVPGIRYEYIENKSEGYINTTSTGTISSNKKIRKLILYGIGSELKITDKTTLYGNYSLAYRPVTFSELTPSATSEIIDPNLKDASGFNADFGYKGTLKNYLSFDVSLFYLNYDNRIGVITQNGAPFKTNIGTSVSKGIESYIEINPINFFTENSKIGNISIFMSNSFIDAKYTNWNNPIIANDPLKSIENKRVENAPNYIHRFGATYLYKSFSSTIQISNVGDVYTDAINTESSNSTATIGKISGYKVMDLAFSYKFKSRYTLKGAINNITNEKYATRRSTGYPGPGLLPANGRTFSITVGVNF
jgi:Fe(3+) dicitrate transport protein